MPKEYLMQDMNLFKIYKLGKANNKKERLKGKEVAFESRLQGPKNQEK